VPHNLKVVGSNPTPATTLWLVDEPGAKRRLQGLPDDRADPGYFDRGWRDGYIYLPSLAGRIFPAVFLLMDAPGIREELRDMARRLATIGYHVLLPNLYYRAGRDTIFGPSVLEQANRVALSATACGRSAPR
jgi:hypothetical protein